MRRPPHQGTIVFAVPDYEPAVGGTSRQVGLQARALARRGHDVVVVTRRHDRSWAARETIDGVAVHRIGPRGDGTLAEKLVLVRMGAWLLRRRRAAAVFQPVMWTDCVVSGWVAGVLARTAVVWAIDGDPTIAARPGEGRARRAQGTARRTLLRRCRHVALTPAMADEVARAGVGTDVTVIPVPVDRGHFRPPTARERDDARRAFGLDDGAFTVVFVGHLIARKGVDRLVEAFAALAPALPEPPRLLLVGGGRDGDGYEEQLRDAVRRARLDGAVTFAGPLQDPRPALWAADVFVLPSFREGMPNSILEAMSCGLPCVAPPAAGGDAVITPDNGVVPPTNEPGDLRAALAALAADPGRARMGEAAVRHAAAYDVERVIMEYERLYERVRRGGS